MKSLNTADSLHYMTPLPKRKFGNPGGFPRCSIALLSKRMALFLACMVLHAGIPSTGSAAPVGDVPSARPKKVFAHFMGCYLVGVQSLNTAFMMKGEGKLSPEGASYLERVGGRWRDYPLTPSDYKPTLVQAADLEIRRAMRMGLDGFGVDVLAGQQDALNALDALFEAAEEHHYPFEITFALDNPVQNVQAVRHLMEKHGKSPNLARRDGKPLLIAYRSHRWGQRLHPEATKADWANPESVRFQCDAVKELEKVAGQPLCVQFDLNGYMEDIPEKSSADPVFWRAAAAEFAKSYGGLSGFFWGGENYNVAAKAARDAGLDWGEPVWYQYESIFWNNYRLKDGLDLFQERWDAAMNNRATLIQLATWNDYTEATHFAPSLQTGYAIGELTKLMITKWKTGKLPQTDKDHVYLVYPPYPKGSRVYPFHDFAPEIGNTLEVVTYLTRPATVTLPGRNASWEAPAGLSFKKFPPAAGPVTAELLRGGKKVLSLTAREPITDRPFRAQHSLVAYSTEDEQCWKEDFPGNTEPVHAYYGDDDGDGLPNWFEMFYFGKLGDFKTATAAKPGDRVLPGGMTNLEAYLAQVNPLKGENTPATVWDLLQNPIAKDGIGVSTNPDADPEGRAVWRYMGESSPGQWDLLVDASIKPPADITMVTYSNSTRNGLAVKDGNNSGQVSYRWAKPDATGGEWKRSVALIPVVGKGVAVGWLAPADGTYGVRLGLQLLAGTGRSKFPLQLMGGGGEKLWETVLDVGNASSTAELKVPLKKGQTLRLQAEVAETTVQGMPEITLFQVQSLPIH